MQLGSTTISRLMLGTQQVQRVMLGSTEVWRPPDADAADYFARIAAAGSSISAANRAAVTAFITGCKADGIWSAIKASCLLCAADTLAGALVPLAGPAPTNFNFLDGDYSRLTGLKSDGLTKHLSTNRDNSEDPQNSKHLAVFVTEDHDRLANRAYICASENASSLTWLITGTSAAYIQARANSSGPNVAIAGPYYGLIGVNRADPETATVRANETTAGYNSLSTITIGVIEVFRRFRTDSPTWTSNARISFYTIGEALDLSLLDARLTTLMASLT